MYIEDVSSNIERYPVWIGEEEALRDRERIIDFGERQEQFDLLNPHFQKLVCRQVSLLSEGKEHYGYNLSQIQLWFKLAGARKNDISKFIFDNNKSFFDIETIDKWEEDGIDYTIFEKMLNKRNRNVSAPSKNTAINTVITCLCDLYLIDRKILSDGKGLICQIKEQYREEIWERYEHSIKKGEKGDNSLQKEIQKYGKEKNISLKELLELEYLVIKHKGSYFYLRDCQNKDHSKFKAINDLMDSLTGIKKMAKLYNQNIFS